MFVKDQLDQSLSGVIVRIFNPTTHVPYTQQETDTNGQASFLLEPGNYEMRFYRYRTTFSQPQFFEVVADQLNQFDVSAEVFIPPISNDARLCRCSGLFRNPDGSAQAYLDMSFYPDFAPILLEETGVVPRHVNIRTNEDGYASIDLIRGGCYRVTVEGLDNEERYVRVPLLASTNLPDLLFPVVERIVFDPAGPWTIAVDAELEVTPTVYDSAGAILAGTGQNDVDWRSSDLDVLGLQVKQTTLVLRGIATGSAELRAGRRDLSIIVIPSIPIAGQPIAVTVP